MMGTLASIFLLAVLAPLAPAHAVGQAAPPARSAVSPMTSDLDRLQSAAAAANLDIARMRIEKWKADSAVKQQAQGNADSLQRNLTTALPGLIDNFRSAPQDLSAGFKLYRNLNALYDVFVSFAETAGAFGPKGEYEALAQQLSVIDGVRRDLGDNLERLTSSNQAELNQLRTQVHTLQQQTAAAAAPPKKVVVDNSEPVKKSTHKKKPSTANADGSTPATAPAPTKAQ